MPAKRKISTAATSTKPVSAKPAPATKAATRAKLSSKPATPAPVLAAAATAQAAAGRSNVVKPAGKPVAAPTSTSETAAKPAGFGITRTAATIAKQATNFGGLSDRDNAYLSHYGALCAKLGTATLTLRQIAENSPGADTGKPRNPFYNGSAKAHDAGVAVRLAKADLLEIRDGGNTLAFTAKARTHAAFASKR